MPGRMQRVLELVRNPRFWVVLFALDIALTAATMIPWDVFMSATWERVTDSLDAERAAARQWSRAGFGAFLWGDWTRMIYAGLGIFFLWKLYVADDHDATGVVCLVFLTICGLYVAVWVNLVTDARGSIGAWTVVLRMVVPVVGWSAVWLGVYVAWREARAAKRAAYAAKWWV